MPNDNIMGIPTRACINGFTKEDTERLKNALVKQILNDETVVNVTEDGKIIIANDDGLFLSFDDSVIGLTKDDDDNVIPVANPYIPMDANDNPLVPANNVIMTSANIAVDPRIVHTTGNETITGVKVFNADIGANRIFHRCYASTSLGTGWKRIYKFGVTSTYARRFSLIIRDDYNTKRLNLKMGITIGSSSGTDSGYHESVYLFKIARKGNISELWVNKGTGGSSISMEFDYGTAGGFPTIDISAEQENPPTVGVDDYTAVVDVQTW